MSAKQLVWLGVLLASILADWSPEMAAQQRRSPQPEPPTVSEPTLSPVQQTLRKKMIEASYQQLKKDTERLLDLATELKNHVDKANEDVLSISVVEKAEEIEKLADKIQSRMKNL